MDWEGILGKRYFLSIFSSFLAFKLRRIIYCNKCCLFKKKIFWNTIFRNNMFVIFFMFTLQYISTRIHWGWLGDWSDYLLGNIQTFFTHYSQLKSVLNILQEKNTMHGLKVQFHFKVRSLICSHTLHEDLTKPLFCHKLLAN